MKVEDSYMAEAADQGLACHVEEENSLAPSAMPSVAAPRPAAPLPLIPLYNRKVTEAEYDTKNREQVG